MRLLIQKGYKLKQNLNTLEYTFTCTATNKGYGFGKSHSECVNAFRDSSLKEMIENYPELAEVDK